MTAERRHNRRENVSGKIHLIELCRRNGSKRTIALYLRDISECGFSGTCFGDALSAIGYDYSAIHPNGSARPVNLVWSTNPIETVHMAAFMVNNGQEEFWGGMSILDLIDTTHTDTATSLGMSFVQAPPPL